MRRDRSQPGGAAAAPRPGEVGRGWIALILGLATVLTLAWLAPEIALRPQPLNDTVLHRLALEGAAEALASGEDPTDFWLGSISLGYPLFHHYQHLGYLPPALLLTLSGGALSLPDFLGWTQLLLLSLFPLSVFWSMRRLGFGRLPAALAGMVAPFLATDSLLGFDWASYVWRGAGLYTQLWGMVLLPPALAQGFHTLRTGRGYGWATLLLAATLLAHLVLGYIALISLGLLAVATFALPSDGRKGQGVSRDDEMAASQGALPWRQLGRLLLLLTLVAMVTAYFWVPYLRDRPYMNRSVWEPAEKYDARGYAWTLSALFTGDLFDFGRLPVLTLLAGLGALRCLLGWREPRYRVPLLLFGLWLVLYFGRPTWGLLLNLLPMSHDLHFHRLIAGVHLGGLYLMGVGLAWPWAWASGRSRLHKLSLVVALALLLLPVYAERRAYLAQNAGWISESQGGIETEAPELASLVETLKALPPGRVYAGLGNNWGRTYTVGMVPMYAYLNAAGLDMVGYLYHALSLNADILVHFDESLPDNYNLFNVRYVVAPSDWAMPNFMTPLGNFGRHQLYQVATTGYFDLVDTDIAFTGTKDDLYPAAYTWFNSFLFSFKAHPALLFEPDTVFSGSRFPLSSAPSLIPELSPLPAEARGAFVEGAVLEGAYEAAVTLERESTLLLKVSYHPNWRATVDGAPVTPMMVMPGMVGIRLAPGSHHVRVAYHPSGDRLFLLGMGILALALTPFMGRRWEAGWARRRQGGTAWLAAPLRRARTELSFLGYHWPFLAALTGLALLAGLPLLQCQIMSGHDALEYLPRAVTFYEGLKAGQLYPRWASDLSAGYGQPFFNFNPPLFYMLSSGFHAFGFSFVAAQNLAIGLLLWTSGLGMYLLAGTFFGRRGGLVAAAAYLFAPYLLSVLYVRHALADFSAFALIPFALWGLYHFVIDGRPWALWVGVWASGLLLLSSNPVSLITFPALGLFLLCVVWAGRRSQPRRWLGRGAWLLGLGMALAAFFWIPALAERGWVHLDRLLAGGLHYPNHFVAWTQLIASPWGYGLSVPGVPDGMSFALGPLHLGVVLAALWLQRLPFKQAGSRWVILYFLGLVGGAAFFSSTGSQPLWDRLPLLPYLEFPWRFLSLAAVGTAFLFGLPVAVLEAKRPRLATWAMLALITGLVVWGLPKAQPEAFLSVTDADYSPQAIASQDLAVTTAREYEPVGVQVRPTAPVSERIRIVDGIGELTEIQLSPTRYRFKATIVEAAYLQVHTFYFPGWTLWVDGEIRPLAIDLPTGIMRFFLAPGEHSVEIRFTDTPIRRVASLLSAAALALLVATGWRRRRRPA